MKNTLAINQSKSRILKKGVINYIRENFGPKLNVRFSEGPVKLGSSTVIKKIGDFFIFVW